MVFDTPAGRIVEAVASGAVTRDEVLAFYAETLPQLGWDEGGCGAVQAGRRNFASRVHRQQSAVE